MSLKNDGSATQFSIQTTYTEALNDCTASCFMYMGASNSVRIMDKFSAAGTSGYGIYRNGNGTSVRGNCSHIVGTPNSATAIGVCNQSTWYHVCVRRTSGTVDFFYNNTKVTTVGTTGLMSTDPLYIGNSSTGLNGWVGNLFKAASWNVSLTDDEVNSLYKGFSPMRIRPQSLKVYDPMIRNSNPIWQDITLTGGAGTWTADATLMPATYGAY